MTNMAKTTKEVLIAAKWLIQNVGWCQNDMFTLDKDYSKPAAFCALGAILTVNGFDELSVVKRNAIKVLASAIDPSFVFSYENIDCISSHIIISKFNDKVITTKNKVLSKFDKAINLSEEV